MGIIRWGLDEARSVYNDQPKEVFTAQGMSKDVLAVPATRSGKGSNKGNPNVITDGSVFNVGVGQAALLIENGKVHDFVIATDEKDTGQYIYDSSKEPSLLTGSFGDWSDVWNTVKQRFSFGGTSPNAMQLVYINLKEITQNPVGVGKIPFIDQYLKTRLMLGAHGYYTFKVSNPATFYENLLMDPSRVYRKEDITEQLKVEMMPRIQEAVSKVAPLCVNGYQDLYLHGDDLAKVLNEELKDEWIDKRGIELVTVSLIPELSPADEARVMQLENAKTLSNTDTALGSMVNAQNNAIQNAAKNAAGAMNGFVGMNMVNNNSAGTQDLLWQKAAREQEEAKAKAAQQASTPQSAGQWTCPNCGNQNSGAFCSECGTKKPDQPVAKFCPECGNKLEGNPKFCPNCGTKLR